MKGEVSKSEPDELSKNCSIIADALDMTSEKSATEKIRLLEQMIDFLRIDEYYEIAEHLRRRGEDYE